MMRTQIQVKFTANGSYKEVKKQIGILLAELKEHQSSQGCTGISSANNNSLRVIAEIKVD